jgi:hypothetical protein
LPCWRFQNSLISINMYVCLQTQIEVRGAISKTKSNIYARKSVFVCSMLPCWGFQNSLICVAVCVGALENSAYKKIGKTAHEGVH